MAQRLPTEDNIDLDDPRQALTHVLVALPFMRQTFTPPVDGPDGGTMGDWSEALTKRGVRWHPELAEVKFRPPQRGQQHWTNGDVAWVDKDEPDPEPVELMDIAANTPAENEYYAEQLHYHGYAIDKRAEPVLAGGRVRGELFDPKQHNVNFVLGYLHNAEEHEIRRVIAAEMTSRKPRKSILDKYKGV